MSFLWMDFLVNIFSQGLNFFPASRSHKMKSHKGLTFFSIYFELVTPDLRPTWNDNARKLPLAPRRCGFPFFSHLFSEEMTCCGSKNDFCKKSGGLLLSAEVQNHPGSSEIGRNLHKIQQIPTKAAATKWELIWVSQVVYYLCGVFFPAFDFAFW
jgi:hypothetical protein